MAHSSPILLLPAVRGLPVRGLVAVVTLLALATTIVGCASVSYKPVKSDSPRPQTNMPACSGSLVVGQRCLARVQADQLYTSTGLNVKARQTYKVEVPPEQVWYDADRRNVPPKGEPGSFIMNMFKSLKRHRNSDWFTLMAAVTNPCIPCMEHSLSDIYDLSATPVIQVQHDGVLAMYPNDALPRRFYNNNSGQIWVFIERQAHSKKSTQ